MNKIAIHSQDRIHFISPDHIAFCKSDNCYTFIHLKNGEKLLISKSLAKFSKELDQGKFIRANQSYLVNINFINSIDKRKKDIELLNQTLIPFTITIKELLEQIGSYGLIMSIFWNAIDVNSIM
ncbi:MAG: hypothetical protein JWQ09_4714 [Segetibacter sp.]|nr:hypothetical protein [Segetibacter sp.]